jgi:hypothetical protein
VALQQRNTAGSDSDQQPVKPVRRSARRAAAASVVAAVQLMCDAEDEDMQDWYQLDWGTACLCWR